VTVHHSSGGWAARRWPLTVCALVLCGSLLVGCTSSAGTSAAPSGQVQTQSQTQSVRGVLLEVVSPSIQQINSFTLRTDDGRELLFVTAPDFNQGVQHVMSPGHMRQHMALADPVEVTYREDNGRLVALSAVDASAPN
jgi:hypothetical protein